MRSASFLGTAFGMTNGTSCILAKRSKHCDILFLSAFCFCFVSVRQGLKKTDGAQREPDAVAFSPLFFAAHAVKSGFNESLIDSEFTVRSQKT